MEENPVLYKSLDAILIASIKTRVEKRDEIPAILDKVKNVCGNAADTSLPLVIFHGGALKEGFLIEAAYPVNYMVETGDVHTRMLEPARALSMLHHGPHQTIRDTVLKIYEYLDQHAWTTSLFRREIYRVIDEQHPENNVTEIQVVLHEWDTLMAEAAETHLGSEGRRILMEGIDAITPESSSAEYIGWVRSAVDRLDKLTGDERTKCLVMSHCAHVFPQERIDHLRSIYEKDGVDGVLAEMNLDHFWYEKPTRRGNVIHVRKNPYDPEGYKNGSTPAERRRAYCHCSFVHPYLDEIPSKLSSTFCYCGAGWYTRLWEGILGKPVKIDHVETLLRGNDQCTLTITLPMELAGEFTPE